ncbi:hypothetical protein CPB86DRAFT_780126 [Serendipita vermifera]|nr:hypothetical protein CPB86DRAFT_780126 [Serendipita vermifera]
MMVMGLIGWVYYPKVVDFEDRKREEREKQTRELFSGVSEQDQTNTGHTENEQGSMR